MTPAEPARAIAPPEDDALKNAFDVCMDALCELLVESAKDVERSAIEISENFKSLAKMASDQGAMLEQFGQTVGTLNYNGGAITMREFIDMMDQQITAPVEHIAFYATHAKGLALSTSAMFENIVTIEKTIMQVHAINNRTRMLALNAAIEAARAKENGRGFSVVATEVKQVSTTINGMAEEVRDEIAALHNALREGEKALKVMGALNPEEDSGVREQLRNIMQSLMTQNQAIVDMLEKSAQVVRDVSAQIGRLTVNIQFQDRNAQLIHNVISVLQKMKQSAPPDMDAEELIQDWLGDVTLGRVKSRVIAMAAQRGVGEHLVAATEADPGDVDLF